jgi:hypothetical protein
MKPTIKVNFADFGPRFQKEHNYFTRLLFDHYKLELTENPDFLFYSVFGESYRKYDCIRIFYTGENRRPNFYECDYAFSFDHDDYGGRNYRLPVYVGHTSCDVTELTREKPDLDSIVTSKTKFCNFLVSNSKAKERIEFFYKLSKYKKVDSGGRFLNNIGGPVKNKMEFIQDYKFTIAFENSSYPGYTTEKILDPMCCHSIPIYWGNPFVYKDFNTKSFINCHEYEDFDEVIERIIEVDSDNELYKRYLAEPYFNNNEVNEYVKKDNILRKFEYIFSNKDNIVPVARTWKRHYSYYKKLRRKTRSIISRLFR